MAQLANLVRPLKVRQLRIELSGSNGFCFLGQSPQGFQLTGDDTDEEEEHQQQTNGYNAHDHALQTVVASEYVALRTDDGHAPTCGTKRFVKHIAVLIIDDQLPHACFSALHRMTKCREGCVRLL